MSTFLQGARVGEVLRGDHVLEVVVWGEDALRTDVSAVRELRIALPAQTSVGPSAPITTVRLGDLGSVDVVPASNVVQREAASRRIDVSCDARGRDLGSVAKDVERAVASMAFPPATTPKFSASPPPAPRHVPGYWGSRSCRSRESRSCSMPTLARRASPHALYLRFGRPRAAGLAAE